MDLNEESILMRVVEHGWNDRYDLELVTNMIIEADAVEYFEGNQNRLNDAEEMFEYTGELSKRIILRAVQIREEQKKNNPNGEEDV